ncbi:hypothetical protein [Thiocapsa marina]|uniref:Uncharacterized protein n=1 Tax=Thiocapsa marina 5811 TaxID=768671 RepID=F9UAJ2_9GAMM|nr:hypothetical protein [Thiocapsa marina]EGV18744.1 hypothetical protein ThimaDRAFT_2162 [Thiocapsa marina 5811]
MGRPEHRPAVALCLPAHRKGMRLGAAVLVAILLISEAVAADENLAVPVQSVGQTFGDQPPGGAPTPWLDEVRAQRQAWEARREATRSAYEARRRANNPRAAAQQEAWEEDVRRRRAARLERMDQDLEIFRSLGPGQPPLPWPWVTGMPTLPELGSGPTTSATPGDTPIYVPPGWDNHWYFRGF